jgi:hypothetical protein
METSVHVAVFTGDFISRIPHLVAWTVAVILAVIMVRRGGGKAEKLFLVGSSLMLVAQLVSPFLSGLASWLIREQGMSRALASGLAVSLPMGALGLSGIVCLVYAFWLRFMAKKQGKDELAKEVPE